MLIVAIVLQCVKLGLIIYSVKSVVESKNMTFNTISEPTNQMFNQ